MGAALCCSLVRCGGEPSAGAASGVRPVDFSRVRIERVYPHAADAFTQGLVYAAPWLFESTGLLGESSLRRVELVTGRIDARVDLAPELFGEGLALVGDRLLQLSWQNGRALIWERDALQLQGEYSYAGEGWGLCHDGEHLVMSDGTSTLQLRDPETFELSRTLDVRLDGAPVERLNELECVGREVLANVWLDDHILRIDGRSGEVTGWIDAAELARHPEIASAPAADVLNGIAYVPERDRLLLTGKRWPLLFEVELVPAPELRGSE